MNNKKVNPHDICTWDENADCEICKDHNLLYCKINPRMQKAFLVLFMPAILTAFFGLVLMGYLTGTWWYLIGYGIFFMILFPVIEFGILCRHCPFYAKEGKILQCLGGSGVPKTYKYSPRPMRKWEHYVMYCYYVVMIGFPIGMMGYGIYIIADNPATYSFFTLITFIAVETALVLSMITFNYCLNVYVCSKCVNFSCPWNGVPKEVVDEYLRQNPVMREAWEKEGYILGEPEAVDKND